MGNSAAPLPLSAFMLIPNAPSASAKPTGPVTALQLHQQTARLYERSRPHSASLAAVAGLPAGLAQLHAELRQASSRSSAFATLPAARTGARGRRPPPWTSHRQPSPCASSRHPSAYPSRSPSAPLAATLEKPLDLGPSPRLHYRSCIIVLCLVCRLPPLSPALRRHLVRIRALFSAPTYRPARTPARALSSHPFSS